jgi:hypothetical protein
MISIADTLADLSRRIAETERRIAELAGRNGPEATLLVAAATETLHVLRSHKERIEHLAPQAERPTD